MELTPGKLYYSIGEVAAHFQVNTSLIRFWEKEFEVLKPLKNKKGNRLFTQQDVDNIQQIYHLVKEKGFTLQGARDYLQKAKRQPEPKEAVLASLLKIRSMLEQAKSSL